MESTKYLVLAALADGSEHGTAIREQIIADTLGIYVSDGTLYATLKSMLKAGLIEDMSEADAYRRVYRLSNEGARLLKIEGQTHERVAQLVKQRLR